MASSANLYRGFRFPAETSQHAVWLYHCFGPSLRDVEPILAARGVAASFESIRERGLRFGKLFAGAPNRRLPRPGDKRFMDEAFIRIRGKPHHLWRAVDQDGHVLDIPVRKRRDAKAAKRFFRGLPKGLRYAPRVVAAGKLRSYGAAKREAPPGVEHRQSRCLSNRAEVPLRRTRRRERQVQRFKSARRAQRFPSPRMAAPTTTSDSAATGWPPTSIAPHGTTPSALGGKRPESRPTRGALRRFRSVLSINLTTPSAEMVERPRRAGVGFSGISSRSRKLSAERRYQRTAQRIAPNGKREPRTRCAGGIRASWSESRPAPASATGGSAAEPDRRDRPGRPGRTWHRSPSDRRPGRGRAPAWPGRVSARTRAPAISRRAGAAGARARNFRVRRGASTRTGNPGAAACR